jgi:sec-independent protein translocase protein TatC
MPERNDLEMPFLDHLEELRWRILWSLLALVIGVVVAFVLLLKVDVIGLLSRPIQPYLGGSKLVYTHPGDSFQIVLHAAVWLGIILAMPVIVYQAWGFVSPALFTHERKVMIPVFFGAIMLFLAGAALAYFIVLPLALKWLMGFQTDALAPMITASEYFGFAISMAIAFGLAFELPIVILALGALGVVSAAFLSRFRRHALVVCFVLGAFLTPGDLIWTTLLMTGPLYLLYEMSIMLVFLIERRRRRRAANDAPGEHTP